MSEDTGLEFEDRMSAKDSLLLRIEADPTYASTIVNVTVFDRRPNLEDVRGRLERAGRVLPRLRQRVVTDGPGLPRWEDDPDFDLENHRRIIDLGGTGTLEQVLEMAGERAAVPLDPDHPLWEMTFVTGLEDGRCAGIQRIHHAITDGVGGVKIIMALFDFERHPAPADEPEPVPDASPAVAPSGPTAVDRALAVARVLGRVLRGLAAALVTIAELVAHPVRTARQTRALVASVRRTLAIGTTPKSPVMTERTNEGGFLTISLPLEDLKDAAKAADCKLNDAFVAAVLGGLARYHEHHDTPTGSINVGMPINLRSDDDANVAGNNFLPARFAAPLDIADPVERMRWVRNEVAERREDPLLGAIGVLAAIAARLPTFVALRLLEKVYGGNDLMISNVPGPPIPLYMAGALRERAIPFGPRAGTALNVTLMSQVGEVVIGVNTDTGAVTDPELMHRCLLEGFDEVLGVDASDEVLRAG